MAERESHPAEDVEQIPVSLVRTNRYQPRSVFNDDRLEELSRTIRTHGMIQPIVVRRTGSGYELVAGERRWRAAQRLGLEYVPAIVRNMTDAQAASVALIENLQREELTPIEEATAYQRLLELHHLTQESLAQRLGKSQSTIANKLRLLQLTEEVQQALKMRLFTERHARALLPLSPADQRALVKEIQSKDMNVKQTEKRVAELLQRPVLDAKLRQEQLAQQGANIKRPRKMGRSRDVRLATNTIRQSIELIAEAGILVESEERAGEGFVEFLIRVRVGE